MGHREELLWESSYDALLRANLERHFHCNNPDPFHFYFLFSINPNFVHNSILILITSLKR